MQFINLAIAIVMIGLLSGTGLLSQEFDVEKQTQWHQWRGPNADGVSVSAQPPAKLERPNQRQMENPDCR